MFGGELFQREPKYGKIEEVWLSKPFIVPTMFCPLISIGFSRNGIVKDILYFIVMILTFWVFAELFWIHMSRPFFSPEPAYEGQYGWFSFENPLRARWFPITGGISVIIGLVVRQLHKMGNEDVD